MLSKKHQGVLRTLFAFQADVCVSGRPRHDGDLLPYTQYLQVLSHRAPSRPPYSPSLPDSPLPPSR